MGDLRWVGLHFDEGPSDEEIPTAEELIRLGYAYRCDCTPERLQREREEQAERKEPVGYS